MPKKYPRQMPAISAVDEAEAAITQKMIALEKRGMSDDAIALGTMHAAVDLIAGFDEQDLVPPAILHELIARRLEWANRMRITQ